MGNSMASLKDSSSVADTSMAILAFLRSGSSPSQGEYKGQVKKAVEFVVGEIESSDKDTLYITQLRGTRVQMKIGTYVDTFAALMALTEAKGTMPDEAGNKRIDKAIEKV